MSMMQKNFQNRIFSLFFLCFLLFSLVLTVRDGTVGIRDEDSGDWYACDTPACVLPPETQKQLEQGVVLPDQTAFTKALEDFCS